MGRRRLVENCNEPHHLLVVSEAVVPSVDGMANDLFHCIVDPCNLDPDFDLDSCKHHLLVVEYPFHILRCDMIPKRVSRARWANRAKWASREDLVPES